MNFSKSLNIQKLTEEVQGIHKKFTDLEKTLITQNDFDLFTNDINYKMSYFEQFKSEFDNKIKDLKLAISGYF